ncbi:MAG: DUF2587 domain-containing protein [Actinobacteria bacterium]|nr:DUF2587 domain-containing protein [Actinomycetota bacterium]
MPPQKPEPVHVQPDTAPEADRHGVVIVGPGGAPIGSVGLTGIGESGPDGQEDEAAVTDLVHEPAKVMRIGSMIKQLLDEVRSAPLDEAARARLREIHQQSIKELQEGLAPELIMELDRLSLPFATGSAPSDAELRIAQAQLVGWLEGLFHGIQAALFAQQMTAKAQFEEMRRQAAGQPQLPAAAAQGGSGQYL